MTEGVRIRAGLAEDVGAVPATLAALAEHLGFGARFAVVESAEQHFHEGSGLINLSDDRFMVIAEPGKVIA